MFTFRVGRPVSCADIKLQKLSTAVHSVAEYGCLEQANHDECFPSWSARRMSAENCPSFSHCGVSEESAIATDVQCGILAIG